MKMREFRENDWDGLAGAERFSDGSKPLIGTGKFTDMTNKEFLVVVDANGISFMWETVGEDGEVEECCRSKSVPFQTQREAWEFIYGLNLDQLQVRFVKAMFPEVCC